MKLELHINDIDREKAKEIVAKMEGGRILNERLPNKVAHMIDEAEVEKIWHAFMTCLLSSQQRSNPDSPIGRILEKKPFPLAFDECKKIKKQGIIQILQKEKGVRFANKIAANAMYNLERLDDGEMENLRVKEQSLREQVALSPSPDQYKLEREAANYLQKNETFKGFGPKQSRNFWQILGLTRYEFVLDSRFMNWLESLDPSFVIPSKALGDEKFYSWLSDILREELCVKADILPCILDAAVFESGAKKSSENDDET